MELKQLIKIAARFRRGIELVPLECRPVGLQDFPEGSCGDASLLLGAYFVDQGIYDFKYICGTRGLQSNNTWSSHAWLQRAKCVVDITADQFPDAPAPVIVANPSLWHSNFYTESPVEADFRSWFGAESLHHMYATILYILSTEESY